MIAAMSASTDGSVHPDAETIRADMPGSATGCIREKEKGFNAR